MHLFSRHAAAWSVAACLLFAFLTPALATGSIDWQSVNATVAMHSIAYDGTTYVSAGRNGIWTSTDLKSWQRATLPATASVDYATVIHASGEFIAVGSGVISSTDGMTWTVRYAPKPDNYWSTVAYVNGIYLAAGEGTSLLGSTDGHTWNTVSTGLSVAANTTLILNGVAWNGSLFAVTGASYTENSSHLITSTQDLILTSTDGLNWTQQTLPTTSGGGTAGYNLGADNAIAWGNGVFVAGGSAGVRTSSDGITWTDHGLPDPSGSYSSAFWAFNRIEFINGRFMASGLDSNTDNELAVFSSTDGVSWTPVDLIKKGASWFGVSALAYDGSKYVVGGYRGVFTSSDLSTWTQVFSSPQSNFEACVIDAGGQFFVPGEGGSLTSSDGTTWPDTVEGSAFTAYTGQGCATYGNNTYVAPLYGGTVEWSTDGLSWTSATGLPTYIGAVGWDGSNFLAVEYGGSSSIGVYSSPDGKAWTSAGSIDVSGASSTQIGGGHNIGGGLARINSHWVAWGQADGTPFVATSKDASTWNVGTAGLPSGMEIKAVSYGGSQYVTIGNLPDSSTVVATSADGITWNEVPGVEIGKETNWKSMLWDGSQFLVVGCRTDVDKGVFMTSPDGVNWTEDTTPLSNCIYGVVYDGNQYVATAYYDILQYSPPADNSGSGGSTGSGSTGSSSTGSSSGSSSSGSPSSGSSSSSSSSGGGGGGGGAFGLIGLFALLGLALRRRCISR